MKYSTTWKQWHCYIPRGNKKLIPWKMCHFHTLKCRKFYFSMFQIEIVVIPHGKMTVPYPMEYASIMETLRCHAVSHVEKHDFYSPWKQHCHSSWKPGNVISHGDMAVSFPMETWPCHFPWKHGRVISDGNMAVSFPMETWQCHFPMLGIKAMSFLWLICCTSRKVLT